MKVLIGPANDNKFAGLIEHLGKGGAMKEDLFMTATQALEYVKSKGISTTRATLLNWLDKNPHLTFQPGGKTTRYYIYKKEFKEFINGHKNQRS